MHLGKANSLILETKTMRCREMDRGYSHSHSPNRFFGERFAKIGLPRALSLLPVRNVWKLGKGAATRTAERGLRTAAMGSFGQQLGWAYSVGFFGLRPAHIATPPPGCPLVVLLLPWVVLFFCSFCFFKYSLFLHLKKSLQTEYKLFERRNQFFYFIWFPKSGGVCRTCPK